MNATDVPVFNGRTPDGRWARGNKGGPGNPHTRQMAKLRAEMLATIRPEHIRALTRRLLVQALEGDLPATRLVLEYACGKPPQAIEVSGPDGEPLGLSFERIQGAILRALVGHPEARVRVAAELRALIDVGGAESPELGPGPGEPA